MNVSLWLNESTSSGLGGLLSSLDSQILFSRIRFDPKLIEINSLSTIKLVNEYTSTLYVPTKYHSNSYHIANEDSSLKFACSVDSTNMKCQKTIINANSEADIYLLKLRILSNNFELTPVNDQLLVYSNFSFP
jgi:hypothetical protein